MIRYHAPWVLPMNGPPMRDAWVAVDHGRIAAIGSRRSGGQRGASPAGRDIDEGAGERDLGHVVLMPGLVNAHTHLELSYLRDELPPASEFVDWIRDVITARRETPDPESGEVLAAVRDALEESVCSGTALVGDISNTLVTHRPLSQSALAAVVFHELIAFKAPNPEQLVEDAYRKIETLGSTPAVRAGLAAHGPHSVARPVLQAMRRAADRRPSSPCSVHLSESPAEVDFLRTGEGPWRALLEDLGVWDPGWVAPGVSPVEYLDECGFLNGRVLAVHGVQMSAADLARLERHGVTLVTCPRSNGHTGAGAPPLEAFYASGVRVAVGTDSLASAPDLNVFAELATMRALAPSVPASALLGSATRQGARALGFEAEYGSLEPGKRARLLAVEAPHDTEDVEEYLVSGIRPGQVRWVDA